MIAAIFDTETTGLIKNHRLPLDRQPKVIEFYGELVDTETGKVIREVEFLANPGFPLEQIIIQITGLTDDKLKDELPFNSNIGRVIEFFEAAEAAVAHNLSYDMGMLNFEARRAEVEIPWPKTKHCTVALSEGIKGHRLKLTNLHQELFGEPFEGAHRAREDVKALTRCYLELIKKGVI